MRSLARPRHHPHLLLVALAAGMLLVVAGCAQTPKARWAQARKTVTSAERTMLTLNDTGVMDDQAMLAADPWVRLARDSLEEAKAYLPKGGPTFDELMRSIEVALARANLPPPESPADSSADSPAPQTTEAPQ